MYNYLAFKRVSDKQIRKLIHHAYCYLLQSPATDDRNKLSLATRTWTVPDTRCNKEYFLHATTLLLVPKIKRFLLSIRMG